MYENELTGSVPDEIGNLGLLEVLYLDHNSEYDNIEVGPLGGRLVELS